MKILHIIFMTALLVADGQYWLERPMDSSWRRFRGYY